MVRKYEDAIHHVIVDGMVFSGLDDLDELRSFTGYNPRNIHNIDENDQKKVTCSIYRRLESGYFIKEVITPGTYVFKRDNGDIDVVAENIGKVFYKEME